MTLMVLLLCLFFAPKQIFASEDYTATQNISYVINSLGTASVVHEINLTNNLSEKYAKNYQIIIPNPNIQNIKGNDKHGDVIGTISNNDTSTIVNFVFSSPTIGKNKTNQFFLNYSIPNFAIKKGSTWEIQLPLTSEVTKLSVPNSFGELSFSSMPIESNHIVNNNTQLIFDQTSQNKTALIIFGNHQLFDFDLNYFIQNQQQTIVTTQIPLPPNTNNQSIIFKKLDPLPDSILEDKDGNWMGEYTLKPNQSINIVVTGQAQIHPPIILEKSTEISNLTRTQQYWPVNDPKIVEISQNLKSAKQIYQYVIDTLNYDYTLVSTGERKGALYALENPDNALCTEFTDLFITLARAANIPAREIEGFAYSNSQKIKPTNTDSDILHAWPEYFDSVKNVWVQVDPTWEKTTKGIDYFSELDLNHLAFVIHGQDSINPPPPGSYKKDNYTKSVNVNYATDRYSPQFIPPVLSISNSTLTVHNPNLFKISPFTIELAKFGWKNDVPSLLPLATIKLDLPKISFWKLAIPSYRQYNFQIKSSESPSPIITNINNPLHYLSLGVCLGIIIIILCVGGIILSNSKKYEKDS